MRAVALGPSVELSLWGHEAGDGVCHSGFSGRWSCLWGHETCEGCAKLGFQASVELLLGPRSV
eukprot:7665747-Pyramimonas_sp.AAC.1